MRTESFRLFWFDFDIWFDSIIPEEKSSLQCCERSGQDPACKKITVDCTSLSTSHSFLSCVCTCVYLQHHRGSFRWPALISLSLLLLYISCILSNPRKLRKFKDLINSRKCKKSWGFDRIQKSSGQAWMLRDFVVIRNKHLVIILGYQAIFPKNLAILLEDFMILLSFLAILRNTPWSCPNPSFCCQIALSSCLEASRYCLSSFDSA